MFTTITTDRLKDLGLYTPFAVSKWCVAHGIESVYLEHVRVKLNRTKFQLQALLDYGYWAVRDSQQPGENLFKIIPRGKRPHLNARETGTAWIEENLGVPISFVPALSSGFATPAVALLEDELRLMDKVWSPVAEEREEVSLEVRTQFLQTYPIRPRSMPTATREQVLSWQ